MSAPPTSENLLHLLRIALPEQIYELLQRAAAIAADQAVPLFLVGGPVRDLILHRPITDLDLVVAGDAWPVAEAFCAAVGGMLTQHAAFRTAVVVLNLDHEQFAIDFVTARRETYPEPAALPQITPSHMLDDLARRDFTINALALPITTEPSAQLLDPFCGSTDIAAGLVRVLHERSFEDDPTRILRAARFAGRLGFRVEARTQEALARSLAQGMLARTTSQRVLHELWLLLDEPRPEAALSLLHSWDALDQLLLVWNADWMHQFVAARKHQDAELSARLVSFGLLVWPLVDVQRAAFAARYNLPAAEHKLLQELPVGVPPELLGAPLDAVALEQLLGQFSSAALHVLRLVGPPTAATQIERYVYDIRSRPALLAGADLQALGLPPGPQYRVILAAARQAQLRGEFSDHAAALDWLRQHVS